MQTGHDHSVHFPLRAPPSSKIECFGTPQVGGGDQGTGVGLLVGLAIASMGLVYYLYMSRKMEKLEQQKVELETQKKELEKFTTMYNQAALPN